jgi:hypothetical protein
MVLFVGVICGNALRNREPVYRGKRLSAWVDESLFEVRSDYSASQVLGDLHPGDRQASFDAEIREVVPVVIERLQTKDNPLWKPYVLAKQKAPGPIANCLPDWREPRTVRLAAARWLGHLGPGLPEAAVEPLCKVAKQDPDLEVRRTAIVALSNIGLYSAEAVPIMATALLAERDSYTRVRAAEWFRQTTPDPEKIVPLLLKVLSDRDQDVGDACVYALASYGHRAVSARDRLRMLAKSDDRFIAWAAATALKEIDPVPPRPIDIYRARGQKPTTSFKEIGLLTYEASLADLNQTEVKLATEAFTMGGDAIILHPIVFPASEESGNVSWPSKALYKASVIVYNPAKGAGSSPQPSPNRH